MNLHVLVFENLKKCVDKSNHQQINLVCPHLFCNVEIKLGKKREAGRVSSVYTTEW